MLKILSVIGTRPNFIKEYLMHRELKRPGVKEVIAHTGQHYDYEMSQIFFDGFELPQPDYHLNQKGKSNIQQTASILSAMEAILVAEKPSCVLVYGDVNSVAAAALASAKLRIPVVHVEGGVRSEDRFNPEEINRRVTDHLSSLIFACTKTDYGNLLRENFSADEICLSGDLMKDSLMVTLEKEHIECEQGSYVLATIHREENVDSPIRLNGIVEGLVNSGLDIVFSLHPRTKKNLINNDLLKKLENCPQVTLLEPQGYSEFVRLLAGANRVFTDSGGVRREAYILGKPVIVPINIVWFPEIVESGWMVTVEPNPKEISGQLREFTPTSPRPPI